MLSFNNSYMILAPAIMTSEKEPKVAAAKCLESVALDPESYRIGHTKARIITRLMAPQCGDSMTSDIRYHTDNLVFCFCPTFGPAQVFFMHYIPSIHIRLYVPKTWLVYPLYVPV